MRAMPTDSRTPFQDFLGLLLSRRFMLVSLAIEVALVLEAIENLAKHAWFNLGLFIAGAIMVIVSMLLARAQRRAQAGLVLIWSMALMMQLLVLHGQGLRDIGMIAYPAILVTGSLILSRRALAVLGAWVIASALLQGSAEALGWTHYVVPEVGWNSVADCLAIMGVTGACVWVMSHEMQDTLENLRTEMDRSRTSQALSEHLASHDHLTGLPNRAALQTLLENALARAARKDSMVAVLFLDLDDFKAVNDSAGHAAGDALLKSVAARLGHALRASDTVSRQGGDEFVIVLDEIASLEGVSRVVEKILGALSAPVVLGHGEVAISCSIGVSLFPQDGSDADTLLKKADVAMYQAKAAGRNTYALFDERSNDRLLQQIQITQALGRAMSGGELTLHYQPQMNLIDNSVIGAEALLRWNSLALGSISPQQFVPIAESSGRIIEIGSWVLMEACLQCMRWEREGLAGMRVSVNVSAVQLARGDLVRAVGDALAASGLEPARLELELTESVFIHDTDRIIATVTQLKKLGVRLAMDDFGTGYSSLSYLTRFQLDTIKIDKSFVMRLRKGGDDAAIASAIIQMADALNLSTIAEGIETREALQFLREHGCSIGQGFLFSRPISASAYLDFARARREELVDG
jgi:diguanylate cyclase (GGDEF)-like protein